MLPAFRPLLLTILLALLPLLVGFAVNAAAPHPPTAALVAGRCTRYCHDHACPHTTLATSPAYYRLRPLYGLTIRALSAGGGGTAYVIANLLVYLVVIPLLLLRLTYAVLRDALLLRRLPTAPIND
ncbi:hypothetical protein [Hymenobacter rubripertinctus]|uniref:DUF2752 domain-containing protein n=1 Tax=Hymenobacter rubripertinctus TaxID=2029981 RepID=A0A418R906_9BACT|nr:hypothetical protein [Hymenobacter rubripertinctus]RIY13774.1 hypothetical protein D0T11_01455 [Hymenobacter rubripertinctus]